MTRTPVLATTTAKNIRAFDDVQRADGAFWTVIRVGLAAVNGYVSVVVSRNGIQDVFMLPANERVQISRRPSA